MLAPQRGLIAIDQNQNREPFIVQSIAKFLFLSFLWKQESSFLWIPGRVSLARDEDSMFPELSNSGSPPAEPGVYLNANYRVRSSNAPLKGVIGDHALQNYLKLNCVFNNH